MKDTLWSRFGFWLERFTVLDGMLFKRVTVSAEGKRGIYENRINRHLVSR